MDDRKYNRVNKLAGGSESMLAPASGILVVDINGLVVEVGHLTCSRLGRHCGGLVGLPASSLIRGFLISDFPTNIVDGMTTLESHEKEIVLLGPSVETFAISAVWTWLGWNGSKVLIFAIELPRQSRIEKSLYPLRPSISARLLDEAGTGIGFYSADSRIIYLNQFALTLMASDADSLLGRTTVEVYGKQLGGIIRDRIIVALESRSRHVYEDPVDLPIGNLWFLSTYVPIFDDRGDPIGVQIISLDITSIKQLKREHETSAALARSIIDSHTYPIFSIDYSYRYTSFNQNHASAMKQLYDADIAIGRSLFEYMSVSEDVEKAKNNLDRALAGQSFIVEAHSGDELRSRRYFEILHSPIKDSGGNVIGVSVLARDLTELRTKQSELESANKRLEEQGAVLERKNSTLREILRTIEDERLEYQRSVNELIRGKIEPLQQYCHKRDDQLPKQLLATLDDVVDKLSHGLLGTSFSTVRVRLTSREIQVCEMIRKGMSSKQIAAELNLSAQTVNKHRQRIRQKLELNNTDLSLAGYLWKES